MQVATAISFLKLRNHGSDDVSPCLMLPPVFRDFSFPFSLVLLFFFFLFGLLPTLTILATAFWPVAVESWMARSLRLIALAGVLSVLLFFRWLSEDEGKRSSSSIVRGCCVGYACCVGYNCCRLRLLFVCRKRAASQNRTQGRKLAK